MKGSNLDRVYRGGPWTWGPCFVYTSHFLCPFLKGLGIGQEAHNSLRAIAAIFTNETQPNSVGVLITSTKNSHA